jgi:hypothetical protein
MVGVPVRSGVEGEPGYRGMPAAELESPKSSLFKSIA